MEEISNEKVYATLVDLDDSSEELDDSTSGGRVQLWKIHKDDGNPSWEKDGCGVFSAQFTKYDDAQNPGLLLLVHSEENGRLILKEIVSNEINYELQGDENLKTMIVWYDNNVGHCLSFEAEHNCKCVWEKIKKIQGVKESNELGELGGEEDFDEIEDLSLCKQMPKCELSKLDEIHKLLETVANTPNEEKKSHYAEMIGNESYIPQLINIFRMCEDLDNLEGLHTLFGIFKSIFNLEKHPLFVIMFQSENIMDVVGILEYDPKKKERTPHREYLNEIVLFKEVIPICNEELLHKIHQTYRAQYIKDILVPIPSLFDEGMSTLSSFIFFNKLDICSLIQEDTHFLETLFEKLTDDEISDDKRREVILLLRELCTYSQSMQPTNREQLIKNLANHGLLQTIDQLMNIEDAKMRSALIDIIFCVVEFSPSLVRTYLCKEVDPLDEDSMLLNTLIDILLSSDDKGQGIILLQLLKTILDTGNMDLGQNKTEKSEFLSFFYRHCMHTLTAPILAATATDKLSGKDDFKRATVLDYIVDILTFCVEQRHYTIRNYIVSKDMLRRVLVLMQSKHKFLALAALRFCRKILSVGDEVYNRCIIVGKLIKPIVEAFLINGKRYNLLNSAILELFEFIKLCKDNLKVYIAENHLPALRDVSYVNTFMEIERNYDQYKDGLESQQDKESNPSVGIIHSFTRKKSDDWAINKDEESWFDSEEDEVIGRNTSDETESTDKKDCNLFENMYIQPTTRTEITSANGLTSDENIQSPNNKDPSSPNHIQHSNSEPRSMFKQLPSETSNQQTFFGKIWTAIKSEDKNKVGVNNKLLNKPFLPKKITSTSLSLNPTGSHTQNGDASYNVKSNGISNNDVELGPLTKKTKPVLTSLVDYPDDDDEDDEDEKEDSKRSPDEVILSSPAKKQRLSPI